RRVSCCLSSSSMLCIPLPEQLGSRDTLSLFSGRCPPHNACRQALQVVCSSESQTAFKSSTSMHTPIHDNAPSDDSISTHGPALSTRASPLHIATRFCNSVNRSVDF